MWNAAQQRLFLMSIFITNPAGGLEDILIKFAGKLGEKLLEELDWKKCKNFYRNEDKLLSLGENPWLILWCAFPAGYTENSEHSHGFD